MPDYVRVRDVSTGHEYTLDERRFNSEAHVKVDKPALGPDRLPLPVKYRLPKAPRRSSVTPKPVPAVADEPDNTDGQKAESEKETR